MTTTETETPPEAEEPPALESPEKPPFWHRPNVERYIVPFVLPIVIVGGLAMFVINISRIFLAGHGHSAVIIGSVITASILLGAAGLSAAPKLRSSSIALVAGGFVASIVMAGWLSVGSAADKGGEENVLPPDGPSLATIDFGTQGIGYKPTSGDADTGIVRISLTSSSGTHTLVFDNPNEVVFPGLKVDATGDTDTARAFFGEPGDYGFHCTVPGHQAMVGTISVGGESKTIDAALAELPADGGDTTATSAP